jgi:hypothetical protein
VLRLPLLRTGLGFVLVIGGTIAAMAPIDVAFAADCRSGDREPSATFRVNIRVPSG